MRRFALEQTVTASTMITDLNWGGKVRYHKDAVEKRLAIPQYRPESGRFGSEAGTVNEFLPGFRLLEHASHLFVSVRDHKLSAGTGRTHKKSLMMLIPDRRGLF